MRIRRITNNISLSTSLIRNLFVTAVVLTLSATLLPPNARGYLLKDEEHGTNLSIFGLGSIRLNYAFVDGEVAAFEDSDDGLLEGLDTQEFLSLALNGTVFYEYALDGYLRYNQEDDPDWNFRFQLSRDEQYLIFGDQQSIFADPYFTRYTNPFRGLTLHGETERLGVTAFGAVTKGASEKEELLPDGTSGPYLLEAIPVVPGSETVTIEVRNRNDQQDVVEARPQIRNVDYTIDYDTGELEFAQPVDTETFGGDPLVIVVTYRSEAETSSFATAVAGARATIAAGRRLKLGMTYVSEFERDSAFSGGFDDRKEIYSFDGKFMLSDSLKLVTEYAVSQDHLDPELVDELPQAFRAELDGNLGAKFDLYGTYRYTERDFLTFANLDVDPDEQELDLQGTYALTPANRLKAGYRFFQDNLPRDPDDPTTTTHRPFLEWDLDLNEHSGLFTKYEFIRTTDDQTPETTDEQTHVLAVGGRHQFQNAPLLKQLRLKGEYQLSDFTDNTDQEADTLTHQLALRAQSEPVKDIVTYVEQRERLFHDKDLRENTERQDISELGVELQRWERFTLRSKYRYQTAYDLLLDEQRSKTHLVTLSSTYQPLTKLSGTGKVEFREDTYFSDADAPTEHYQSLNLEGRLLWTPKKDLTARVRYEYEQNKDQAETRSTTREDTTEFRLNYAFDQRKTRLTAIFEIERDLLEAPPTPRTKTRTITYLFSGARQMSDRWDVLAQYKRERVDLDAEDMREDLLFEVGYKLGRFIKCVGGCQHTEFEDHDDPTDDYTADSVYVKIIGKL